MIDYNGQTYFLQQNAPGEFQYTFNQPKDNIEFALNANDVVSKKYNLEVINVPTLVGFDMVLDYPSHTKKSDETLKSTGSAVIPEGTKITWKVNTKSTSQVQIYSKDTLAFTADKNGNFEANKRLYNNLSLIHI